MLKKTVTYTNFNDEEITEDLYFNITKSELMEMQLTTDGGMDTWIKGMIDANDIPELTKFFKKILLKAYGEKSIDGKHFNKSEEISKNFEQSAAYDAIFMELLTTDEASKFINGIMPKDVVAEAAKLDKK